jgi:hypothetical protein
MATTAELIASAKEKLAVVIAADPAVYVDYRVADKTVNKSQYVEHLLSTIQKLSSADTQTDADLDIMQFDHDISPSGEDNTQYTVL